MKISENLDYILEKYTKSYDIYKIKDITYRNCEIFENIKIVFDTESYITVDISHEFDGGRCSVSVYNEDLSGNRDTSLIYRFNLDYEYFINLFKEFEWNILEILK